MKTVKIKKISGKWHVFCLGCKKWISLILFKKRDNTLVCVICGFVINQDEQKWQFL
jgi:rRNA maturation endonuclease Nob1